MKLKIFYRCSLFPFWSGLGLISTPILYVCIDALLNQHFLTPVLSYDLLIPRIVRLTKSRRMIWAGHVALMGEGRGVYRVLAGKPGGKRLLGRPRHRWEDNINMDLQEVGVWIRSSWLSIGTDGGHL